MASFLFVWLPAKGNTILILSHELSLSQEK